MTQILATLPQGQHALFITRFFPYPAHAGDTQYSDHLIRIFAERFERVTVLCTGLPTGLRSDLGGAVPLDFPNNVRFDGFAIREVPVWRRVLALCPNNSLPFESADARAALAQALAQDQDQAPDHVVIDHIGASWALRHLPRKLRNDLPYDLPVTYCSHNDEVLTRRSISRHSRTWLAALPHRIDTQRVAVREHALAARVCFVTAISRADMASIGKRLSGTGGGTVPMVYLPPAWRRPLPQRLDPVVAPRAIVLLGSLTWQAKRDNMVRFLSHTADGFAREGVQVIVAGQATPVTIEGFRRRFPTVRFLGEVPDERSVLGKGRIGILMGEAGGGFRLSTLTLALHGMPIAAPPSLVRDLGLSNYGFVPLAEVEDGSAVDRITAQIDQAKPLGQMAQFAYQRALCFVPPKAETDAAPPVQRALRHAS